MAITKKPESLIKQRVNQLQKEHPATNFHGIFGGSVAQTVEQRTENPCVGGSIPSRATKKAPIGAFFIIVKIKVNNSCPSRHRQILLDLL